MTSEGACCGADAFMALAPARQAECLALLAQEARLLQFSLDARDAASVQIGDRLQRALERALDADGPDETRDAQCELEQVLTRVREAGMRLSAQLGEMDVDGVAGTMTMRVLTTVLAAPPA